VLGFTLIAIASVLLLARTPGSPCAVVHGFATAAEGVVIPLIVGSASGTWRGLPSSPWSGALGPVLAGWWRATGSYAVFTRFALGNVLATLVKSAPRPMH
jgi:hypothetical protein